ncbi:5-formyltetrahydrofolate cyclo-ligase [Sporolactobacillus shoreicorticis]|uniref:5-formyltetrahydrofolate cyclo-ligase n=1 Tax=Sporolactobacillus shoreicorticis TaxID=1923877 RepID=A0ABW5S184_9BACL|nr:5-formyltetrahydrofolate cyclo-ligase [Sporolactobacillus shoreicorticis]MCO7128305.1 5-formyltetrahydrofolate cyclo-ligase [Sporolactobacillus shoreicorticis]
MNRQKKAMRNRILHEMDKLDEYVFTEKCKKIRNRLFATSLWQEAGTIGITLSIGREIETMAIITKAWTEAKRVAVPKCNPNSRTLSFYILQTFSQLDSGFYGLMEPNTSMTEAINKKSLDLLIVPGIVFNHQGYRIGYGGGYYDRFLSDYEGVTVSLLLESQLVGEIPVERHDQHVDWMITEKNIYQASEKSE